MKFVTFFIITLFINSLQAQQINEPGECFVIVDQNVPISFGQILEYVQKNNDKTDVEAPVKTLKRMVNICKIDVAKYGLGSAIFDFWIKQGLQAEYKFWKEKINRVSTYGSIDLEISKLKYYAKRNNIDKYELQTLIDKYKKINRTYYSAKKERQNCTSIDLRNNFQFTVKSDSLGWCYASAVSDMLSYRLRKNVSTFWTALNYTKEYENSYTKSLINRLFINIKKPPAAYENMIAGVSFYALISTLKNGICLEKDLRSTPYGNQKFITVLRFIEKTISEIDLDKNHFNFSYLSSDIQAYFKYLFPNLSAEHFNQYLSMPNINTFIYDLAYKSCNTSYQNIYNLIPNYVQASPTQKALNVIDQQLDQKNIVGISYHSDVLTNKIFRINEEDYHASTIIARQYNKYLGQCEYLIKNSWGPDCSKYAYNCSNGNIWLPRKALSESLKSITYLSNSL